MSSSMKQFWCKWLLQVKSTLFLTCQLGSSCEGHLWNTRQEIQDKLYLDGQKKYKTSYHQTRSKLPLGQDAWKDEMGENGQKWMKMDEKVWKWMKDTEMDDSGWKRIRVGEMDENWCWCCDPKEKHQEHTIVPRTVTAKNWLAGGKRDADYWTQMNL